MLDISAAGLLTLLYFFLVLVSQFVHPSFDIVPTKSSICHQFGGRVSYFVQFYFYCVSFASTMYMWLMCFTVIDVSTEYPAGFTVMSFLAALVGSADYIMEWVSLNSKTKINPQQSTIVNPYLIIIFLIRERSRRMPRVEGRMPPGSQRSAKVSKCDTLPKRSHQGFAYKAYIDTCQHLCHDRS